MRKSSLKVVIPARSGSKGVPRKNIRKFVNKSLLELAINFSCKIESSSIIISSDSDDYFNLIKKYEIYSHNSSLLKFHKRSKSAASDNAKDFDVVNDILNSGLINETDTLVWIRPTSPLRSCNELKLALNKFEQLSDNVSMIRSIKKTSTHPYWMKTVCERTLICQPFIKDKDETNYPNRQSLPDCYEISSEFDIVNVQAILEQKTFFPKPMCGFITNEMPKIDIDTEFEFKLAEAIVKLLGYENVRDNR